jgi:sortase A
MGHERVGSLCAGRFLSHPLARRLVRDLSYVLILTGVWLALDAGVTLVWQEPVTAVIALIKRSELDRRFLSYRDTPLSRLDRRALVSLSATSQRIAYLARLEEQRVPIGAAIGRIAIPKIGESLDVVQGTSASSLEKGPGHYPGTAFPGLGQTVAIAGHRTTYLAPFRRINELGPGDKIVVTMPYGRFTYVVEANPIVVLPTAWWITRDVGYERLVLSACHPLYSASHRIVVFARLASVQPQGAARTAA